MSDESKEHAGEGLTRYVYDRSTLAKATVWTHPNSSFWCKYDEADAALAAKDQRITDLEAELERRRELMAEVEWVFHEAEPCDIYECPWCGAMCLDTDKGVHQSGCTYAALTEEKTDE